MKYESLIFDIDGTLWDTREAAAASYNRQMEEDGYGHLAVTAERLLPLFGKTLPEIADIIFDTVPKPRRYKLVEDCSARLLVDLVTDPSSTGFPGVAETMEKLAKNHRLFIVSNSDRGYPEIAINKLGIGHLISGHMCYGDTLKSKGYTIRKLMETHGIENGVYIGDTQGDYLATVEADVPFIWCSYGFGTPDSYVAKLERFSDLLTVIE